MVRKLRPGGSSGKAPKRLKSIKKLVCIHALLEQVWRDRKNELPSSFLASP